LCRTTSTTSPRVRDHGRSPGAADATQPVPHQLACLAPTIPLAPWPPPPPPPPAAGALYAAKFTQTNGTGGGAFDIEWILLGEGGWPTALPPVRARLPSAQTLCPPPPVPHRLPPLVLSDLEQPAAAPPTRLDGPLDCCCRQQRGAEGSGREHQVLRHLRDG
jgi:hypothetical protein